MQYCCSVSHLCEGGNILKVKDIMTTDVISVTPQTDIGYAAKLLLEKRINGVPVVDEQGTMVGILCQSDLIVQQKKFPVPSLFTLLDGFVPMTSMKRLKAEVQKMSAATVAGAMSPNPVTVTPEATIEETANLMVEKNVHTLPVVKGGSLVGVVGKQDILRTLLPG
jgi:CBS domain-containing protein